MPDPITPPVPAPAPVPALDPSVQVLAQDAVNAVALGKSAASAIKSGGAAAALPLLPNLVAAIMADIADTKAALPAIKAGYKTTEFWLVLAVFLANGIFTALTSTVLPIDLNIVLAAIVAIYTVARALVKKPA